MVVITAAATVSVTLMTVAANLIWSASWQVIISIHARVGVRSLDPTLRVRVGVRVRVGIRPLDPVPWGLGRIFPWVGPRL